MKEDRSSIRFLVIGGGPCGIASVGKLVDEGFSVLWVDPKFGVGRMGAYYRQVPANTLNSDLIYAMTLCQSFHFEEDQKKRLARGEEVMSVLSGDHCHALDSFVQALDDATAALLPQTKHIAGVVTSLHYMQNCSIWKYSITCSDGSVRHGEVQAVVLSTGCRPKAFPGLPDICGDSDHHVLHTTDKEGVKTDITFHSLDLMVNPEYCEALLRKDRDCCEQRWGVVGNSHSAMLVIKNLIEQGAKNVVCFIRSPLRFMFTNANGTKKFQGTGLKGPVGDWVLQHKDLNTYQEVFYDPAKTWSDQLTSHHITDCVIAAGFTRDDDIEITVDVALNAEGEGSKESVYRLTGEDLDDYDVWSGEIKLPSKLFPIQQSHIALYGGGIAFPQFYRDEEGEEEPWIGVKRSIQQTELMIKSFLAARSTHHHEYIEII